MRYILVAVVSVLFAGCATEPNFRNVWPVTPGDWQVPKEKYEHQVSAPLKYEDLPDYVDQLIQGGWDVESTEPAGPEFPSCYLVVSRRFKS